MRKLNSLMNLPLFWIFLAAAYFALPCLGCGQGSREVGNCLHTFLERDFQAIEAIVYPDKNKNTDRNTLLLDGQELEDQCRRLSDVVACLEELQHTCYYYHEFFAFRKLVTSLRKSIDWTCRDLRGRFRTLLSEFHCLETARINATAGQHHCRHHDLPANIWQRIIRSENGIEICPALRHQIHCLQARGYLNQCGTDALAVYRNLTDIFMNSWCSNGSRTNSDDRHFHATLMLIAVAITFMRTLFV